MFPIPFNFPFRKKNGDITTIGDAIGSGGGGEPYVLPIATADKLGGIKVGSGLSIIDGVLSATGGGGGSAFHLYSFNTNNTNFPKGYVISKFDSETTGQSSDKSIFKNVLFNGIGFVIGATSNRIFGIATMASATATKVRVETSDITISNNAATVSASYIEPEFSYMSTFNFTKIF